MEEGEDEEEEEEGEGGREEGRRGPGHRPEVRARGHPTVGSLAWPRFLQPSQREEEEEENNKKKSTKKKRASPNLLEPADLAGTWHSSSSWDDAKCDHQRSRTPSSLENCFLKKNAISTCFCSVFSFLFGWTPIRWLVGRRRLAWSSTFLNSILFLLSQSIPIWSQSGWNSVSASLTTSH